MMIKTLNSDSAFILALHDITKMAEQHTVAHSPTSQSNEDAYQTGIKVGLEMAARRAKESLFPETPPRAEERRGRVYNSRWTEEQAIAQIKKHADGNYIPVDEWNQRKLAPSVGTLIKLFGSYVNALEAAGFTKPSTQKMTRGKQYSDEQILKIIRRQKKFLSTKEWEHARKRPSVKLIISRFGTWSNAWLMAGKGDTSKPSDDENREAIRESIRKAHQKHGFLTGAEWDRLGLKPTYRTIIQYFSSDWLFAWLDSVEDFAKRENQHLQALPKVNLSDWESYVMKMRSHWFTLEQIGEIAGVSRERVRQVEESALKKLAKASPNESGE